MVHQILRSIVILTMTLSFTRTKTVVTSTAMYHLMNCRQIVKQQTVIRILWMTHASGVLLIQSNLQQLRHAFLSLAAMCQSPAVSALQSATLFTVIYALTRTAFMSNFTKCKSLNGASNIAFDNDSDNDTIIYENEDSCDEYSNVSSDELSSDSEATDSDSDSLDDARVWCSVDTKQPATAPPRFLFTGQPGCKATILILSVQTFNITAMACRCYFGIKQVKLQINNIYSAS